MAGRGGRPSPAPPPLQGGEPALCTAPSPRLASFLDRCPWPGGDALPQPAPRHRGRAPHCFLPGSDARNVNQAFRAFPPTIRTQLQLRPGPSISSRVGLPLPRGHRRRRQRGRKNTGKLLSYLQRARAHTQTHLPLGLASRLGQPRPGVGLKAPSASEARTRILDRSPQRVLLQPRAAFPWAILPQNNLTAPPSPMYKSVFSIEIRRHNLTPPTLATLKPSAFQAVLLRTQEHNFTSFQKRQGRCSQSFPGPLLPPPNSYPGRPPTVPSDGWEARRQEAGTESARTTAPAPSTPKDPRVPALIRSCSTQAGRSLVARASAPGGQSSAPSPHGWLFSPGQS